MSETDRIAQAYRELESGAGNRYDFGNAGNRRIFSERRLLARRVLEDAGWVPFGSRRALEVGCGNGFELAWLLELGASESWLAGVDLLPDRIARAKRAYPGIDFRTGNAEHLEFADGSFDLLMASTVFSSILDGGMARNVATEIRRVMRPGGGLLWYDFRYDSPANRHVRGVPERRVRELFPGLVGKLHTVTVIPPLARRLGPLTDATYPVLAILPPLRSHLLGLLRKPD